MDSTGRIRITEPSCMLLCNSTARAMSARADTRRSATLPVLRNVMKPAPVMPAGAARLQGWPMAMSPTV